MQLHAISTGNASCHLGMDHFGIYLQGQKFKLISDHRPLEKLGKVHRKTLNHLQEVMNAFDFDIIYKKAVKCQLIICVETLSMPYLGMPLNYSRLNLPILCYKHWKNLLNRELPNNTKFQSVIKLNENDCFIEDDIVWRCIKRQFEPSQVVIFLPAMLVPDVLAGNLLVGHNGIYETKECLLQCYYWPGMDADITAHLKSCHHCQMRWKDNCPPPALLLSLPQPTEPNQWVHADLFGPLKTSDIGKSLFCVWQTLTKSNQQSQFMSNNLKFQMTTEKR